MIGLDPHFIARHFGWLISLFEKKYKKPHPDCDYGCMYVCTEGFIKSPKCNKEKNT